MSGRILIADDVATNRIVLKVKLGEAFYQPLLAADGLSCLAMARSQRPDLILLDLMLPDIPGTAVLARLRADPATADIPVIVLTSTEGEEARIAALEAGADDFLPKSTADDLLLARIRCLLRAQEALAGLAPPVEGFAMRALAETGPAFARPGTVSVIGLRAETGGRLRRLLHPHLGSRVAHQSREEALNLAPVCGRTPDIYVIDASGDREEAALRLIPELRSRVGAGQAEICLAEDDPVGRLAAMAYDLGASEVFRRGLSAREMALRLVRLMARKQQADRLRASVNDGLRMAMIDPLTGLHNRRYAMAQLEAMVHGARVTGRPLAVMLADIDRFKAVNDRHGHGVGDKVLVEVGQRIAAVLQPGDLLARIGGEEFLIALPDRTLAEAQGMAERLCRSIDATPLHPAGAPPVPLTLSIGLAGARGAETPDVPHLVDLADRALMLSKTAGRNMVTVSRSAA